MSLKNALFKIKCIEKATFTNTADIVSALAKKTSKSKLSIFLDMLKCSKKYGSGPFDYQEFEFYNLNEKERETYMTRTKNNAIVRKFNKQEDFYIFDDKGKFNETFSEFMKRDWLVLDGNNYEKFEKFCHGKSDFIAKIIDGYGGAGIELIQIAGKDLKELYDYLLKNNLLLVEEKIIQHTELAKLNSTSVNTLRIVSFFDGEKSHILNTVFKIGNGGITDNFSSGSMYTFVEDGKIIVPAIDRNDDIYEVHPISKINLIGYNIPNYDKALELVTEAAAVVPSIKYVGWDVAITQDDACLIEGNCYPGVYQIKPSFVKEKIGLVPVFEKAMNINVKEL